MMRKNKYKTLFLISLLIIIVESLFVFSPTRSLLKDLFYSKIHPNLFSTVAFTPTATDTQSLPPSTSKYPGPEELPPIDIESRIHIKSIVDIERIRKNLIEFIWEEQKIPESLPEITKNIEIEPLNNYESDLLTINMGNGFVSYIYHFRSGSGNKQLIIYHSGHNNDPLSVSDFEIVKRFLEAGYDVLMAFMPLFGPNTQPEIETGCCGPLRMIHHNYFIWVDKPIRYFIEPVSIALNYAGKLDYGSYYMVGLSGGGWTTVLTSAIDSRIKGSFPVAGSLPLWARQLKDIGDFEQWYPDLYRIANYLDLYILGAYGENRFQIQIMNKYDPIAFAGTRSIAYEKAVEEAVAALGQGRFSLYIDDSITKHTLSQKSFDKIIHYIEINQ